MLRLAACVTFVVVVIAFAMPMFEGMAGGQAAQHAAPQQAAAPAREEREEREAKPAGYRSIALKADRAGHFSVETVINGRRLQMIADTGATSVVLTAQDARRIGIRPREKDFTVRMRTANGETTAAPVVLDEIRVGAIRVRDVRALVARPDSLGVNLLGMSFIGALKRFEMRGDELILVQ